MKKTIIHFTSRNKSKQNILLALDFLEATWDKKRLNNFLLWNNPGYIYFDEGFQEFLWSDIEEFAKKSIFDNKYEITHIPFDDIIDLQTNKKAV